MALNLLCLLVYLAAVACSAVRIVRGSQWRMLAWSWLAALLARLCCAVHCPASRSASGPDWSFGAFGFVAAVVLFGQPLA